MILPHRGASPGAAEPVRRLRFALLDAGIDDWGGVSPVTADHVNPERPWPDLDRLREVTEERGHVLAPRLTVYPEFVRDRVGWLDESLHFPVMDRSDAEWLGRDDPGQFWPEKTTAADTVADGAEFVLVGHRSTAWYSGADNPPPPLVDLATGLTHSEIDLAMSQTRSEMRGAVGDVLRGVEAGEEPGVDEIVTLLSARGPEVAAVAALADEWRRRISGDTLTWVANRNINYTNVCTFKCKFCGFSKGPLSLNLRGTPYLLTLDDIAERAKEGWDLGATEVTLQGGIHPDFDGDYYIDVTKAVKDAVPDMHVHGFTALEVTEGAKRLGEDLATYLQRLKDVGLASLPGTAAEILDDEARAILCPDKVNTEEWLEAHRAAHSIGLHSNVTMMFGAIEETVHQARHLVRTRDLQKENVRLGQVGFTEFVGLPFVHMASPIYLQRKARRGPTFRENLLIHAVARLAYGDLIPNVQASWVKIGLRGVRSDDECRLQRPGRNADGREHLPCRGCQPRPGHDRRQVRRLRRRARSTARAAHHQLRPGRRVMTDDGLVEPGSSNPSATRLQSRTRSRRRSFPSRRTSTKRPRSRSAMVDEPAPTNRPRASSPPNIAGATYTT